jgi:hypothetical protein
MPFAVTDVLGEFDKLQLPDKRTGRRVRRMVAALAKDPRASFPVAMGSVAATEAAYRWLRNRRTVPAKLIEPHHDESWARARQAGTVLSLEDTTEMRFGGRAVREGLGLLLNNGQGFFLHAALLVAFDEHPVPLGVAAYEVLVREKARNKKDPQRDYADPKNERRRWTRVLKSVDQRAAREGLSVIHVGDRETDDFGLMAECYIGGGRFVFRMRFDRRDACTDEVTSKLLEQAPILLERDVELGTRTKLGTGRRKPKHPRPQTRSARLAIRATEILLRRSKPGGDAAPYVPVNVVEVIETSPPPGEEPVLWRLATTEPISTPEEVGRIVDIYRARWLIEEYWKSLKTGCAFEERQLESRKTLENALVLFMPIAWQLLLIRAVARATPKAPASAVLSPRLLLLLRRVADRENHWNLRLVQDPTAHDAALAIARLGGHLPQNGDPGWQVLRRGLQVLLDMQATLQLLGLPEM